MPRRRSQPCLQENSQVTSSRQQPAILTRKRKSEQLSSDDSIIEIEPIKRHCNVEDKEQWDPEFSTEETVITSDWSSGIEVPSSEDSDHRYLSSPISPDLGFSERCDRFRSLTSKQSPPCNRKSTLPALSWADPKEVWELMVKKDLIYTRDPCVLNRHPGIQPKMRSILLDWLIEVCEVYRLHRETYYLAIDFLDRYLGSQKGLAKQHLQLVGISCLFIAAKIEQIYPPALKEFAFVTDGACTADEILCQELIIMKGLNWDLCPVTPNSWLNIYMQIANLPSIKNQPNSFVVPQYSANDFVKVAQLIDLCSLEISSLQFTYSKLAASAIYHVISEKIAFAVSGFKYEDLMPCIIWMYSFATTLRESDKQTTKFLQQVQVDEMFSIQTHDVDLKLLEQAQVRLECAMMSSSRDSPINHPEIEILTPPPSDEKIKIK